MAKEWITKSGRFYKGEIMEVQTYLESEAITKNALIIAAVNDVVKNDLNITRYQTKAKTGKLIMCGKFRAADINRIDQYRQEHKLTWNVIIRAAVMLYVNEKMPIKKDVGKGKQSGKVRKPTTKEVVKCLSQCVDVMNKKSESKNMKKRLKDWNSLFSITENIERLGALFGVSMSEDKTGVPTPTLGAFEESLRTEYTNVYNKADGVAEITELRRALKLSLSIDSDIFEQLTLELVELGHVKILEGSGEGGLRFRGRNYMFLKKKRAVNMLFTRSQNAFNGECPEISHS